MPSTYTTNGAIQKPADGEQDGTWGDIVNVNMDILDRLTNGVGSITLSAATYTLTTTSGVVSTGHYKTLVLGGSPAAAVTITVSPNTAQRWYFVRNVCGQNVTIDQGSGSTVTLGTGQSKIIYCDGAGATAAVVALSNSLAMGSVAVTGGAINNATIGATTPSTGAFTTLSASGVTALTGDLAVDTNVLFVDTSLNRVGVGTVSPVGTLHISDAGNSGSDVTLKLESSGSGTSVSPNMRMYRNSATPTAGDAIGAVLFQGNNNALTETSYGAIYGSITAPNNTVESGELIFQTTRLGTLQTAAIMDTSGNFIVGKSSTSFSTAGTTIFADGHIDNVVDGSVCLVINRLTSDGALVQFGQAGTIEGSISVSGTTVSYNGGHLSRWAQMPGDAKPALLKGTVLSNLDEMSEWPGEANEQLNRVKVSDTMGDRNVAGVFVAWEDNNDLRMAMTGDMVIRIAAGRTVARGDLLMSDGTGCAMSQADDLVRNSTIAKVTSSRVSIMYPDGSYCVPCVVMAC